MIVKLHLYLNWHNFIYAPNLHGITNFGKTFALKISRMNLKIWLIKICKFVCVFYRNIYIYITWTKWVRVNLSDDLGNAAVGRMDWERSLKWVSRDNLYFDRHLCVSLGMWRSEIKLMKWEGSAKWREKLTVYNMEKIFVYMT